MPRRTACQGSHHWVPNVKRGTAHGLKCAGCPAIFPCRENCAHTDCEAETGRTTTCPVCRKPVAYLDGFHYSKPKSCVLVRVHAEGCRAKLPTTLGGDLVVIESDEPDGTGGVEAVAA